MARFYGFPNAATWVVYDTLTRHMRVTALRACVRASSLDNETACLHLCESVREASEACIKQTPESSRMMCHALIGLALEQVVWGELLVALRWHFVGSASCQSDGAAHRESGSATQHADGVGVDPIV